MNSDDPVKPGVIGRGKALVGLLSYSFRQFPILFLATLLSLLSVGLELAAMMSLFPVTHLASGDDIAADSRWRWLMDAVGAPSTLRSFLLLFLGLMTTRLLTDTAASLTVSHVYRDLIAHFSSRAFKAFVQGLSFRDVQKNTIGYYISLAGDEANRASQIVMSVSRLVPVMALAGLYWLAITVKSPWTGGGVSLFIAIAGVALLGSFRRSHQLGTEQQLQSRILNTHFVECLNSLRTIRAYNAEGFVSTRYADMIGTYVWTCFKVDALKDLARTGPSLVLVFGAAVGAALLLGDGSFTDRYADFVVLAILLLRFFPLLGQSLDIFMRTVSDLMAGEEVTRAMSLVAALESTPAEVGIQLDKGISSIEFESVGFRYHRAKPVIDHLNARFERGQSYALIGPSGAGKSTLIDLLLKLYAPTEGRILVNGGDLAGISSFSVRQHVGVVEQQVPLFHDSILHNLTLGVSIDREVVRHACEIACLNDVIARLPQGEETVLHYQGSNLSGGQRQRLGIARAVLRRPEVLVLDESTAALDHDIRERVVTNLIEEFRDRILLFVTHDRGIASRVSQVLDLARLTQAPICSGRQPGGVTTSPSTKVNSAAE